jgi:hypothetical protein
MAKLNFTHEINCNAETFWRIFLDKNFNEEMFRNHMKFPEFTITAFNDGEKQVTRQVKARPNMDMPAAVKKVLGDSFAYTEDGTLDKATKIWRFKTTPSAMADKIKNEGTMRIEPAGENKVKRISEIIVEAKIFLIGGMIEENATKALKDGWDKAAAFMNQWIKDGKHNPTV